MLNSVNYNIDRMLFQSIFKIFYVHILDTVGLYIVLYYFFQSYTL